MSDKSNDIESVKEDRLVLIGDFFYLGEELFTGIAEQECAEYSKKENDSIWIRYIYYMPYKDGIKNGLCNSFYKDNNQHKYKVDYKNGEKNGLYREWFDNGKLSKEGVYENGKKEGIWKSWFDNGRQKSEIKHEINIEVEEKNWYENCRLKDEFKRNGITENADIFLTGRGWYNNGQLQFQNYFDKTTKSIVRKEWNINGRLEKKYLTDYNGVKYLFEREFNKNNVLCSEKNYKIFYKTERALEYGDKIYKNLEIPIKKMNGYYKSWNSEGKLYLISNYVDGIKNGIYKKWHFNGKLEEELFYITGKLDGVANTWNAEGKMTSNKIYKNGRLLENNIIYNDCIKKVIYDFEYNKEITEYRAFNGELSHVYENEISTDISYKDDLSDSIYNNTSYNDQLDMDQQSPEFWDDL